MLTTTTNSVEGRRIVEYKGIVYGAANWGFRKLLDIFGRVRKTVVTPGSLTKNGREATLGDMIDAALAEMCAMAQQLGANAVIGVDIDHITADGKEGNLISVIVTGTAVRLE